MNRQIWLLNNEQPEMLKQRKNINPMKNRQTILTTTLLALACFALLPRAQAVVPAPDGGYPGGNTAEGQAALLSLATGTYNTATGIYSLLSLTDGNFNTALGAGTLLANTADENTATGAGALLSNTAGSLNTANGAFALFSNTTGDGNTASGVQALFSNTTGEQNTATGYDALYFNTANGNTATGYQALLHNTTGSDNTANGVNALVNNTEGGGNTAIGRGALFANTSASGNTAVGIDVLGNNAAASAINNTAVGSGALLFNTDGGFNTAIAFQALFNNTGAGNTALGYLAGYNLTTGDDNIDIGVDVRGLAGEGNTIRIGDNLPQGEQSNCYIGGVFDGFIGTDSFIVGVNPNNKVGDTLTSGSASKMRVKDVIQDHKKVAELEATVAALAAQLKEQTAQIQRVDAKLK